MHPNRTFRQTPRDTNLGLARDRGFGTLAVSSEAGPLLAHVPFVLSADAAWAEFHLLRSNPILKALTDPQPAVIAVAGPDGYVSPDWYGAEDQVPTWNYVAVHLRGPAERLEDAALGPILDRLSAAFEERLLPKTPWTAAKMDDGALSRMMRTIVPCRMRVDDVEGTWKLNQNKPDTARLGAADQMEGYGIGQETRMLSALMRNPPPTQ